jgi:hypothetical protein
MQLHQDERERRNDNAPEPQPGTEHTTDPQENMEGPMSSAIKGIGDAFETDESKEEADREKDQNT